ncbi:MAG: hypothetical protein M3Y87_36415 [Myxococcota bacterium]|nr:hypothetical protein [Myxococcota bacterium]
MSSTSSFERPHEEPAALELATASSGGFDRATPETLALEIARSRDDHAPWDPPPQRGSGYTEPRGGRVVRDEPILRGGDTPLEERGPLAILEALLKSPASVLHDIQRGGSALPRLCALVIATMLLTGLVMATFSGGMQLLLVPLKLSAGIFFCALICLPSLHIFSCLAGAEQTLKETWGALLMGVALLGVLLVGFAPVTWVFSQATSSAAFMGALHLMFLLISCVFGLGLVQRSLAAMNRAPVRGTGMWSVLFVLVLLQMTTTLRPLVGSYGGALVEGRLFFLTHWIAGLG